MGWGDNVSAAPQDDQGWHWGTTTAGKGPPRVPAMATAAPWGPGSPTAEGMMARLELARWSVRGESSAVGAKFGT